MENDKLVFLLTALADAADECDNRGLFAEANELLDVINVLGSCIDMEKSEE